MFTSMSHVPVSSIPSFETRKALIIINLQNDSLYVKDEIYITKNHDFVPRLKEMIPYFRKNGDIVWVNTHMGVTASPPPTDSARVEEESNEVAEKNRQAQNLKEQQIEFDAKREEAARRARLEKIDPKGGSDYPSFYPSSKTKDIMAQASAETRAEKRSADLQVFKNDKGDSIEKHLSKPRKGQQARFYIAGTRGAEICDDLVDVVDEELDLIVTKHHYSAFDQTSLLTALRTKLVTEVYLCGILTNVGVYSTAADAVQHGLQVTVVEDCLGYRSEDKHEEALRQMADIMGVNGIDSEEIIEESGGRPVPDAETPGITLEELSLNSDQEAAEGGSMMVGMVFSNPGPATAEVGGAAKVGGRPQLPPVDIFDPSWQASLSPVDKTAPRVEKALKEKEVSPTARSGPSASRDRNSWQSRSVTLGPNDSIGSGDSKIIHNVIGSSIINNAFSQMKEEVDWQTMFHRSGQVPRLVAVQGEVGKNGDIPIYRHPADESPPLLPFTPMVQKIRQQVVSALKQSFNHALIQLYRDGQDNISEHSDKTLDIARGTSIVNVSIGAQRVMILRTKKSEHGTESPSMRQTQRIKMPHNSVFVLGPQSNKEWLHGVRADKRPASEKTDEEKAFEGERISITFRQIGTFMNKKEKTIWGSGAKSKSRQKASRISTRDNAQMEAMIKAFGKENHDTDFDWDAEYGSGFNVVNLVNEQAQLFLCNDSVANLRVQLSLCEKSISCTATQQDKPPSPEPEDFQTRFHPWMHGLSNSENPVFKDIHENATAIEGDLTIMFYLEKHYPFPGTEASVAQSDQATALIYSQTAKANELLFLWREMRELQGPNSPPTHRFNLERPMTPNTSLFEEFHSSLWTWETLAGAAEYITGDHWTIIDCAFWPVLSHVIGEFEELNQERYPNLLAYHQRVMGRECVGTILGFGK